MVLDGTTSALTNSRRDWLSFAQIDPLDTFNPASRWKQSSTSHVAQR